jgi:hypothetical protein
MAEGQVLDGLFGDVLIHGSCIGSRDDLGSSWDDEIDIICGVYKYAASEFIENL